MAGDASRFAKAVRPTCMATYPAANISPRSPKDALLDFLESAYQAGAQSAGWDIEELRAGPAV